MVMICQIFSNVLLEQIRFHGQQVRSFHRLYNYLELRTFFWGMGETPVESRKYRYSSGKNRVGPSPYGSNWPEIPMPSPRRLEPASDLPFLCRHRAIADLPGREHSLYSSVCGTCRLHTGRAGRGPT